MTHTKLVTMLLTSISLIMFYILPNNLVIFWNKFGSFKRNTIILGHTLLDTSHNTGALHINLLTRIIPSVLYQNPPFKLFSGLWSCLKTISSTTDDKLRSVTSQKTRTRTHNSTEHPKLISIPYIYPIGQDIAIEIRYPISIQKYV